MAGLGVLGEAAPAKVSGGDSSIGGCIGKIGVVSIVPGWSQAMENRLACRHRAAIIVSVARRLQ